MQLSGWCPMRRSRFDLPPVDPAERTVTALDLNNGLPFVLSHRHGLLDGAALRELPRQTSRLGFAGSKF